MNASDNPHLLVVDDDQRLRNLLQRYLSANGFRVTAAADAVEARTLIKSIAFDALILDVMMPGESGLDLTADLRARSDVPILMLTALGDSGDRIAGLERGVDDYLPKPFEPRELMLRLGAIIRRARNSQPPPHREVHMGKCVFDPERGELKRSGDKRVKLTGSGGANALEALRRQCRAGVFARHALFAAEHPIGALGGRAGHAAAP